MAAKMDSGMKKVKRPDYRQKTVVLALLLDLECKNASGVQKWQTRKKQWERDWKSFDSWSQDANKMGFQSIRHSHSACSQQPDTNTNGRFMVYAIIHILVWIELVLISFFIKNLNQFWKNDIHMNSL